MEFLFSYERLEWPTQPSAAFGSEAIGSGDPIVTVFQSQPHADAHLSQERVLVDGISRDMPFSIWLMLASVV